MLHNVPNGGKPNEFHSDSIDLSRTHGFTSGINLPSILPAHAYVHVRMLRIIRKHGAFTLAQRHSADCKTCFAL